MRVPGDYRDHPVDYPIHPGPFPGRRSLLLRLSTDLDYSPMRTVCANVDMDWVKLDHEG